MTKDQIIDEMVRDFTQVIPHPKSEVRSRLEALYSQGRADMKREILEGLPKEKKYTEYSERHADKVTGSINRVSGFNTALSEVRKGIIEIK